MIVAGADEIFGIASGAVISVWGRHIGAWLSLDSPPLACGICVTNYRGHFLNNWILICVTNYWRHFLNDWIWRTLFPSLIFTSTSVRLSFDGHTWRSDGQQNVKRAKISQPTFMHLLNRLRGRSYMPIDATTSPHLHFLAWIYSSCYITMGFSHSIN